MSDTFIGTIAIIYTLQYENWYMQQNNSNQKVL